MGTFRENGAGPWLIAAANGGLAFWAMATNWSVEMVRSDLCVELAIPTVSVGAVLLIYLVFAQYEASGRPTPTMRWTQAALWLGLASFGMTAVCGDEDGPLSSHWTDLVGWSPERLDLSESIAEFSLALAAAACLTLVALLSANLFDMRRHHDRNAALRSKPSVPAGRRRDLKARTSTRRSYIPNRSRRSDEHAPPLDAPERRGQL